MYKSYFWIIEQEKSKKLINSIFYQMYIFLSFQLKSTMILMTVNWILSEVGEKQEIRMASIHPTKELLRSWNNIMIQLYTLYTYTATKYKKYPGPLNLPFQIQIQMFRKQIDNF